MAERVMHQIGEAASRVGLSLRTVRYYEEVRLVVPSGRTDGGFRLYTDEDIARLALIKQLKPLDFSLDDLRELLETRDRLGAGQLSDDEQVALAQRLQAYSEVANRRCDELRELLRRVEAVTSTLESEASSARGSAPSYSGASGTTQRP